MCWKYGHKAADCFSNPKNKGREKEEKTAPAEKADTLIKSISKSRGPAKANRRAKAYLDWKLGSNPKIQNGICPRLDSVSLSVFRKMGRRKLRCRK